MKNLFKKQTNESEIQLIFKPKNEISIDISEYRKLIEKSAKLDMIANIVSSMSEYKVYETVRSILEIKDEAGK